MTPLANDGFAAMAALTERRSDRNTNVVDAMHATVTDIHCSVALGGTHSICPRHHHHYRTTQNRTVKKTSSVLMQECK
jgi:hypothetical protein